MMRMSARDFMSSIKVPSSRQEQYSSCMFEDIGPMFAALPKNEHGNLNPSIVRYCAFVEELSFSKKLNNTF